MATKTARKEQARFDTRLPKEQKQFFEKAAKLGGYRSLTDFIILVAQEKAQKIITEKEQIIASQRDSELFFDAIINAQKPNDELVKAVNEYKSLTSK